MAKVDERLDRREVSVRIGPGTVIRFGKLIGTVQIWDTRFFRDVYPIKLETGVWRMLGADQFEVLGS